MGLPPSLREASAHTAASGKKKLKFFRQKWVIHLARVLAACLVAIFLSSLKFDYIESYLYDMRMVWTPAPTSTGNVVILMTDKDTVDKLKAVPTIVEHTQVLGKLREANPRHIVYVSAIAPIKGADQETSTRELKNSGFLRGSNQEKNQFAQEAAKTPQLIALTDELELKTEQGKNRLVEPFQQIRLIPGPRNSDKLLFAKDGVTRRILLTYQDQPLLHPMLAAGINESIKDLAKVRGQVQVFDSDQVYIRYLRPGSFPVIKFEDILQGSYDAKALAGKIILVGDNLGQNIKDYISTPYSRELANTTVTEMHAHMLDTLIRNDAPIRTPRWINLLLTVIIGIWTIYVVMTLRPLQGLLALLGTTLSFFAISWLMFWPWGYWLQMSQPLMAIFLCYYFFIPYRLIIENRRSWEYYERNRLLSQVEELKTNFISMMSHDLKTPIARIQGMVDTIVGDSNKLSSTQREALDLIRSSSSDLLHFMNSILNYAMIESKGVELHLESRDPNLILEDVIKKHDFHAKTKAITINSQLDPLFSIKMDPHLIRQVFSNLLENAIKYSPEKSKIKIHSYETENCVCVEVADQGPGIPQDEIDHVFMKFFRSKNAKSSPIKGSGLGLYLAKYFVELHKGRVYVKSIQGEGSTFVVELPTGGQQ